MRCLFSLSASLALATCGGDQSGRDKVDATVACEQRVKARLLVADSFDPELFNWVFSRKADEGFLRRGYKAQNAFGTELEQEYDCIYNFAKERVIYLRVKAPGVDEIVIDEAAT